MTDLHDLRTPQRAYALLRREGLHHDSENVEVFKGRVVSVPTTADIPIEPGSATIALLPHRQIVERGFEVHDDGTPLLCLVADERDELPLADVLAALPPDAGVIEDLGFDVSDADYAEIVTRVLDEEIGLGEGSNFVIHRTRRGR